MNKRVYISADYASDDGNQEVVDVLHIWGTDNKHMTDFIDTAQAPPGIVSEEAGLWI